MHMRLKEIKASEIKELSQDERLNKLKALKEVFFNLRFQHSIDQLDNPKKMNETKKDIARVKTVIREFELEQIK